MLPPTVFESITYPLSNYYPTFSFCTSLTNKKWYLSVFILMYLILSDLEHFFMYFMGMYTNFSMNHEFISFALLVLLNTFVKLDLIRQHFPNDFLYVWRKFTVRPTQLNVHQKWVLSLHCVALPLGRVCPLGAPFPWHFKVGEVMWQSSSQWAASMDDLFRDYFHVTYFLTIQIKNF